MHLSDFLITTISDLRCSEMFNNDFATNLLPSPQVKEFLQIDNCLMYTQEYCVSPSGSPGTYMPCNFDNVWRNVQKRPAVSYAVYRLLLLLAMPLLRMQHRCSKQPFHACGGRQLHATGVAVVRSAFCGLRNTSHPAVSLHVVRHRLRTKICRLSDANLATVKRLPWNMVHTLTVQYLWANFKDNRCRGRSRSNHQKC